MSWNESLSQHEQTTGNRKADKAIDESLTKHSFNSICCQKINNSVHAILNHISRKLVHNTA